MRGLSRVGGSIDRNVAPGPERPATAHSLPDQHKEGKYCRRLVQHQPRAFRTRVFPVCLNLSVEIRDGIALARHVNPLSALTSKTRHATKSGEVRHFVTLLNSGDTATLLRGTRHAPVKSADVPGTQQMVHSSSPYSGESSHEGSNEGYRVRGTLRASVFCGRGPPERQLNFAPNKINSREAIERDWYVEGNYE
jgi:hypothetical protein